MVRWLMAPDNERVVVTSLRGDGERCEEYEKSIMKALEQEAIIQYNEYMASTR